LIAPEWLEQQQEPRLEQLRTVLALLQSPWLLAGIEPA
jgi:hypothetical protein